MDTLICVDGLLGKYVHVNNAGLQSVTFPGLENVKVLLEPEGRVVDEEADEVDPESTVEVTVTVDEAIITEVELDDAEELGEDWDLLSSLSLSSRDSSGSSLSLRQVRTRMIGQ